MTAINRGEDDLGGLELYDIVPTAAGAIRAVVPGPDLPSDAVIEISRDNGATWTSTLPSGVDASVTTVRATGIAIPGLGLAAPRPSFYVGIRPNNGLTEAIGRGYAFTEMYGLNATQTKEVTVDATVCRPPCGPCADPTPNDDCSMAACNSAGECETVYRDLGASCEYSGADKLCVTGPFTCQGSRGSSGSFGSPTFESAAHPVLSGTQEERKRGRNSSWIEAGWTASCPSTKKSRRRSHRSLLPSSIPAFLGGS